MIDSQGWPSARAIAGSAVIALCLWISFGLILHMWISKHDAPAFKKIRWTIVLLIPILGWMAYPACFDRLSPIKTPYQESLGS